MSQYKHCVQVSIASAPAEQRVHEGPCTLRPQVPPYRCKWERVRAVLKSPLGAIETCVDKSWAVCPLPATPTLASGLKEMQFMI